MKQIDLRITFNETANSISTIQKISGVKLDSVTDIIFMIGVCENLKTTYQTKLNEKLRMEGGVNDFTRKY
jgi:hypothetical protein